MNTRTKPRASTTLIEPCECSHHDWLTCWAEQNHTSRFNALFITVTPTVHLNGRCECLCHQDNDGRQVSVEQWAAKRTTHTPEARPKNRNAYLNFHKHAEAKRRRGERV